MGSYILPFLLLFFVIESLCYSAEVEEQRNIVKIGEKCERDRNCIENAYCYSQRICRCETNYAPSQDNLVCTAVAGLSCNDDAICVTMANGQCKQNICTCKENFMLDISNSSNCMSRPTKDGDLCQREDECKETLIWAQCVNAKCRCYSGYRYVNETKQCIKNKGIYHSCEYDYECFLDDTDPDVLQCRNKECVCKEGEPRCSKGSLYGIAASLVASLFLLQWMI